MRNISRGSKFLNFDQRRFSYGSPRSSFPLGKIRRSSGWPNVVDFSSSSCCMSSRRMMKIRYVICSMTCSGLESPPDQKSFQMLSIWLRKLPGRALPWDRRRQPRTKVPSTCLCFRPINRKTAAGRFKPLSRPRRRPHITSSGWPSPASASFPKIGRPPPDQVRGQAFRGHAVGVGTPLNFVL